MRKQVRLIDLPDALINAHAVELAPFSVALVRVTRCAAQLIGSGTLVRHRDTHGILTARHVAEQLHSGPEVGIVLHKSAHRFSIEARHLDLILSATGATEQAGPDIAFVRLPDANLGTIKAVRSFVNLEHHKKKMESRARERGPWCIFGFPEEKASMRTAPFCVFGQCGVAPAPQCYVIEGAFDYYWVPAVYSSTNALPESYGGVSGGGLWQTEVLEERGEFRIIDYLLRGVAFYQTARDGDSCFIKCHGDASIYSWLVSEIESKYS